MNENECRAKNETECNKNQECKPRINNCGCSKLFALKLKELMK